MEMKATMKIQEVPDRSSSRMEALLTVWEDSVRATHRFLSDAEVRKIKTYVPRALAGVQHLIAAENTPGVPIAFLGAENGRLEMLFVASSEQGKGVGKALLQFGIAHYGIRELTVNEQNPQAIGFYTHVGFAVWKRTEQDEEGNPYPLLYMKSK